MALDLHRLPLYPKSRKSVFYGTAVGKSGDLPSFSGAHHLRSFELGIYTDRTSWADLKVSLPQGIPVTNGNLMRARRERHGRGSAPDECAVHFDVGTRNVRRDRHRRHTVRPGKWDRGLPPLASVVPPVLFST